MTKRTNIPLDTDLVRKGGAVLGTSTTAATVHAARRESVRRAGLARLAERDLVDLPPEELARLRRPRSAGS